FLTFSRSRDYKVLSVTCRQNPTGGHVKMRAAKVVLILAIVLGLTLVVMAKLPQQGQPQPGMKTDPADPGFEAAHDRLYNPENRAKEANRLTQTLAPALPESPEAYAPLPHK